ncbi:NAD(P)/FAD-dependent oxidoreductase [Streptosporangium sp. NPDC048047]|uniref:flavin-containing monooxygenase n=1 Tax=Streptosporangium sp. NPDC048047 TaxID=3155748 RepID=UPI0034363CF9
MSDTVPERTPEHIDVLIVGAGLSGIGAAAHLRRECPRKSLAILESRGAIGGTWDLFRYPGIRSDSDMFTLGYSFRPWTDARSIADGPSIRSYVADTAREYGLGRHIRFHLRVTHASWSSETARWTVTAVRTGPGEHGPGHETGHGAEDGSGHGTGGGSGAGHGKGSGEGIEEGAEEASGGDAGRGPEDGPGGPGDSGDSGETVTLTCSFLMACTGYYRYDEGYRPALPGEHDFRGPIVHPQHWPDDLDHTGRRVVVIGSGATAVTLVPALAEKAEHVTMLQRSPTYVAAVPSRDRLADRIRRHLPARTAYRIVRWKNVLFSMAVYRLSRRRPKLVKALLRRGAAVALPAGFDVDTHFAPSYDPWDQRLCAVPDGDLFRAVREGRADVVTDHIERLTPDGVTLRSGRRLPADIVVTATGLNLLAIGGMRLSVDGRDVELPRTLAYKGMMLSGVPNFSLTVGYTNASWTLKADLVSRYVCRLLRHMDAHGHRAVTPVAPDLEDRDALAPLIDLKSGYVLRSAGLLPRQGPEAPWRLYQNYLRDVRLMRSGPVTDGVRFTGAVRRPRDLP